MYRSDVGVGELVVHTTDSTWVRQYSDQFDKLHDETSKPYRRIVGLDLPDAGSTIWVPDEIPADSSSGFNRDETAQDVLTLPKPMIDRILEFFDDKMSENGFKTDGPMDEKYNCHRFAAAVSGIDHFANVYWPREFVKEKNERDISNPLPLGQIGVIGALVRIEGQANQGLHSVIGLGEDRDECLQVMWTQGHMGITRYSDILKFYKKHVGGVLRSFRGIAHVGLYSDLPAQN